MLIIKQEHFNCISIDVKMQKTRNEDVASETYKIYKIWKFIFIIPSIGIVAKIWLQIFLYSINQ